MSLIRQQLMDSGFSTISALKFSTLLCGFEYLNEVTYQAKLLLTSRKYQELELASRDLLLIFHCFFRSKSAQWANDINRSLESASPEVRENMPIDKICRDKLDALQRNYGWKTKTLCRIMEEEECNNLADFPGVKSNFNNEEFFAVMALYQISNVMELLHNKIQSQDLLDNELDSFLDNISKAIEYGYDAQAAINFAKSFQKNMLSEFSPSENELLCIARSEMSKKGVEQRLGKGHHLRREKIIEWYKLGTFKSRRQAALRFVKPLVEYIDDNRLPTLKAGAEYEVIYKWLTKYDHECKKLNMRIH